jgi:hypothetical protein
MPVKNSNKEEAKLYMPAKRFGKMIMGKMIYKTNYTPAEPENNSALKLFCYPSRAQATLNSELGTFNPEP